MKPRILITGGAGFIGSHLAAERLVAGYTVLGRPEITPQITGKYRAGDTRHCSAGITPARDSLGFTLEVPFDAGLSEFIEWLTRQRAIDRIATATSELSRRGLVA